MSVLTMVSHTNLHLHCIHTLSGMTLIQAEREECSKFKLNIVCIDYLCYQKKEINSPVLYAINVKRLNATLAEGHCQSYQSRSGK